MRDSVIGIVLVFFFNYYVDETVSQFSCKVNNNTHLVLINFYIFLVVNHSREAILTQCDLDVTLHREH